MEQLSRLLSDPSRLAALRRTTLLDSPPEEAFDRLTRLAASALRAPVALITLLDEDRQYVKSAVGLPEPWPAVRERPLERSFCQHAVAQAAPLVIEDGRSHPLVNGHPALADLDIRAYLGIPIFTAEGHGLGTFAVADREPRAWSREDVAALQDLAALVVREIEYRSLAREQAALLESTDQGLWGVDREGRCTFINETAVRLLGWDRHEVLGRRLHDLAHRRPDGSPYPWDACPVAEAIHTGRGVTRTNDLLFRKDGTSIPVEYSALPVIQEGRVTGAVVAFRDVTERRHLEAERDRLLTAEQAARAAAEAMEQRYRDLVQGLDAIVWEADAETFRFTFVSRRAEEILGYPAAQWLEEPTFWADHIHPEDREWAVHFCTDCTAAGQDHAFDYRCLAADGRVVWLRDMVRVIKDQEGKPRQLRGVMVDITEQKRLEAELREQTETLETLNEVGRALSAELDLGQLVQRVTDAATALTGAQFGAFFYNVVDERGERYQLYTISGAPKEAFAQFPAPRNTALFGPTFRGEGVIRLDDVRRDPRFGRNPPYYGHPPGHLPVASYLAVPVISRSGEVLGGLFFGHERPGVFTERAEQLALGIAAQAAVALDNARLYQEAQRVIQQREEFLSIASHELKTPLTTVKGYAQLLERQLRSTQAEDERLHRMMEQLKSQIRRLEVLVADLLDISRLQQGRLELRPEPVDLQPLAAEVLARFEHAPDRTPAHTLVLDAPEAVAGVWDRDRLDQVLTNLLSNALKYSPEGGEVRVTLRRHGDTAELAVSDQGIGIPAEEQARLFSPFSRASTGGHHIEGVGLGLYITQQIVARHQGEITVESAPGRGSRFTVRLPLHPAVD
ncbi:MAG TPA: GAF domain-containing protein [Dehalococcoidia bacterium]